jgi:hypothetical protein
LIKREHPPIGVVSKKEEGECKIEPNAALKRRELAAKASNLCICSEDKVGIV